MNTPEPWVWSELEPFLPSERSGVIAVDVGANEGGWSKALSARFWKVWAFEPQLGLTKADSERVMVENVALAASAGELYFTRYANSAHLSALFREGGINTGPPLGQVSYPAVTLDSYRLVGVGFIKIDVEGAEVLVLHGAQATIQEERPLLVVEIHTVANGQAVQDILESWRYRVQRIAHPDYRPGSRNDQRHFWLLGVP